MIIKRNKLVLVLLAAFFIVLIMHKVLPFILLFNSVPGQRHLDDVEQLRTSVDIKRVSPIPDDYRRQVLSDFAARDFSELGSRNRSQSMKTLRTVLACFARGENIEACNALIRSMYVWGRSGSDWKLNPEGDYDFTTTWMVRLLYEFGHQDEIFYPETRDYFVNTLLNLEGGPVLTVPLTFGMVFDTENHILMRESSRYLKNQWMAAHGNDSSRYDNKNNGMEKWMVRYLNSICFGGVYEYNSMPYVTYTVLPLLNLADYAASPEVKMLAISILDNICKRYAYGSLDWKQCTSFRRQFRYANSDRLDLNPIELPLRFWAGVSYSQKDLKAERGQMLLATVFSNYTPTRETLEILQHKPAEYYAVFAHRQKGVPEIYSGSADFLLSAGGAFSGNSGHVIARPITLLLPGQSEHLTDTIRIEGTGDWKTWNMTGVHQRFAVAKGRVVIPDQFNVLLLLNQWTVFKVAEDLMIAVYQADKCGLLVLFPKMKYSNDKLQEILQTKNPTPDKTGEFIWPQNLGPMGMNKLSFDIHSVTGHWVIMSVNGKSAGLLNTRNWKHWPKESIEVVK